MRKLFGWSKQIIILCVLFGAAQMAWAAPLVIPKVDVDATSGDILHYYISGGVPLTDEPAGATRYFGGLFDAFQGGGPLPDNTTWYIRRTFNGGPEEKRPLYGMPPWPNGLGVNNIMKLVYTRSGDYFTAYPLSNGFYGGSGNGVNGQVYDLAVSSVGDLYVAGNFTQAGGFPYSSGIGVYQAQSGWNTSYIFSAFNYAKTFTWVSSNKLKVEGLAPTGLWEVDFNGNVLQVSNNTAYWNLYYGTFGMYDYWSAQ